MPMNRECDLVPDCKPLPGQRRPAPLAPPEGLAVWSCLIQLEASKDILVAVAQFPGC